MKVPELKIGSRVDIVFENEIMKSGAHYMKASVYDCEAGKITISQTSPALSRNFLGRRIMVTFLVNVERRILRFGFPAKLVDLITDYKIASSNNVDALIIEQFKEPELVDFRLYFRVTPYLQSNISLVWKENKVNLIDISLGGAKFSCSRNHSFQSSDLLKIELVIGSTVFYLNAMVRGTGTPYATPATGKKLQYVSIKFEHDNKQLEASLGKAIIEIERQLLSEGKI
jgi:hypothetical protein